MLREGYWNQQRRGAELRNWSLSRTMKWDGRGRLREREYSAPWFCAVKKKWPGKYATETTRIRVQQGATPRVKCRERPSRRLDDIHNRINQGPGASLLLLSVKKLLLMRHKYRARLFKDKRTATGTNFHSVAIKIRFRPAFRCTPRMLLPPPPLDGLLTDRTNYGCKNASKKNSPQTDCQRDGARKR